MVKMCFKCKKPLEMALGKYKYKLATLKKFCRKSKILRK